MPKVTILMATFNGATHLPEQLTSIVGQSHSNWQLTCSDDGSSDTTWKLLQDFVGEHPGQLTLRRGPGAGFSKNFMSLISTLPKQPGFVCFADQDDIWFPDKIKRGLMQIACSEEPVLYCGRRTLWYPQDDRRIETGSPERSLSLRNALIENVATGNTILLNPAAAALARSAAQRTDAVFAHDWWLYLLITACGGKVHFDPDKPQVLYRQHGENEIGAGLGLRAQIKRKAGVLTGVFSDRIAQNLSALKAIDELLTEEARSIVQQFDSARDKKGLARLTALHCVGPYRQRWIDSLGFWGAASLGRI